MAQPGSVQPSGEPGSLPARKILAFVTTGGFTHAAPVLEICSVLASRGHTIEFATLAGQESWAKDYPFIKAIHTFGQSPSDEQAETHYRRMMRWNPQDGISPIMKSKYLWDSFWTAEHAFLKGFVSQADSRPDLIIADFFCESAAKDMLVEFSIPLAVVWPQMPFLMAPVPYIPGQPGFQVDMTLTSEHASLWSRLRNEMVVVWGLPEILAWMRWTVQMRRAAGVTYKSPTGPKPGHLVLVNSFFGLEAPKDLPPLIAPVGPILSDEYPPLGPAFGGFLEQHDRTLYIALGTHIILPPDALSRILRGIVLALDAGYINGVIWSIGTSPRKEFDLAEVVERKSGPSLSVGDLLEGKHSDEFLVPTFAPQRAILEHASCRLYFTHGGGSSANEVLFHGKPALTMGFFFDQLCNSARLRAAGVGLSLDKFTFTSQDIADKIGRIVDETVAKKGAADEVGPIGRNVERMRRIATIASRRKQLAADLVEEVMYDAELRRDPRTGRELQPMHLQTADARMSAWRAKNWDMLFFVLGCTVVLPLGVGLAVRHVVIDSGGFSQLWKQAVSAVHA